MTDHRHSASQGDTPIEETPRSSGNTEANAPDGRTAEHRSAPGAHVQTAHRTARGLLDAEWARAERARRGLRWQSWAAEWLRSRGFAVDERAFHAPFDLLINGWLRIDVKSAIWTSYRQKHSYVRGFVFTGMKGGADCDAFLLVCHHDDEVEAVFAVPASMAPRHTITITPSALAGLGRYGAYRIVDAISDREGRP